MPMTTASFSWSGGHPISGKGDPKGVAGLSGKVNGDPAQANSLIQNGSCAVIPR